MTAFAATVRYELRMQLRKPTIWIATVIPFGLFAVLASMGTQNLDRFAHDTNPKTWLVEALGWFTTPLAMVFGMVLADRLVRDRKLGVAALLDVTPTNRSARLAGKYLGACAATAVPPLLIYLGVAIQAVSKTFRGNVRALDAINLTVAPGILGLLGANGAGKTTLMRLLTGLLRPDSGQITIGEHDMATADGRLAVQRVLGYLPQDLGMYPDLTAREFLDYVALLKGLDDRRGRRRRVGELLELVNLADASDRKLRGYSGGMRRRVGIAQALLNDPELLIVDEPTAGLDPEERIRFRTLLSQLAERRTVVLSTHIVDDVAQTCTEVAILGRGKLIYRGTESDLTAQATGNVWSVVTNGPVPSVGTVLSALPDGGATRYRIVAPTRPSGDAEPVAPTLEDGYVALAQQHRLSAIEPVA
jgi:ABC-type multidrug transport system ATPase subunit